MSYVATYDITPCGVPWFVSDSSRGSLWSPRVSHNDGPPGLKKIRNEEWAVPPYPYDRGMMYLQFLPHIPYRRCHKVRDIGPSWLCAPRMRGTVSIAYGLAHRYRRLSIRSGSRRESGHLGYGAATPRRGPQGSCCDG